MKIWNIAKITLFFAVVVIVCRFVLLPFVFPRKYQKEIEYFSQEYHLPESLVYSVVNIKIGCWYLDKLIHQFDGIQTALAAYNAGSGNVSKWLLDSKYSDDGKTLKEIPYGETKRYVKKVIITQKIYQWLYDIE